MDKMWISGKDGQVMEVKKYNKVERYNLVVGLTKEGMTDLEIQKSHGVLVDQLK